MRRSDVVAERQRRRETQSLCGLLGHLLCFFRASTKLSWEIDLGNGRELDQFGFKDQL